MEKYTVSQELAQKLKEAGYPQSTLNYWHSVISHDLKRWSAFKLQDYKPDSDFGMKVYAAPLSDELLEQLPRFVKDGSLCMVITQDNPRKWSTGYSESGDEPIQGAPTPPVEKLADDLAQLWLWCKENGHLPTRKDSHD